jgi:chromosome segregation ATPase
LAFGKALGRIAEAKVIEVRQKQEEIDALNLEVAALLVDKERLNAYTDKVARLSREKVELQTCLLDKEKKAAEDAGKLEGQLRDIHAQIQRERQATAEAMKAKADETETYKKMIQDLESQAATIAADAKARDDKIDALEAKVAQAAKNAESTDAAKARLELSLNATKIRLAKHKKALNYNETTLDYWRPRIFQSGYDLCREKVKGGTSVEDLPAEVAPPPGWWGDLSDCLPGQPFDDWPEED